MFGEKVIKVKTLVYPTPALLPATNNNINVHTVSKYDSYLWTELESAGRIHEVISFDDTTKKFKIKTIFTSKDKSDTKCQICIISDDFYQRHKHGTLSSKEVRKLLERLHAEMRKMSASEKYELAAKFRDEVKYIKSIYKIGFPRFELQQSNP